MRECLITFCGTRDPFRGMNEQGDNIDGPILSFLKVSFFQKKYYNKVVILPTSGTLENVKELKTEIQKLSGEEITADSCQPYKGDPLSYIEIMKYLRTVLPTIYKENSNTNFTVFIASGTPQMHACWLLIAASAEFKVNIVNLRDKIFEKSGRMVKVNLDNPGFPLIKTDFSQLLQHPIPQTEIQKAVKEVGIAGNSPKTDDLIKMAQMYAKIDYPVLILGESGTGKELMARLIHTLGQHPELSFVAVNCAALPETLIESELFGFIKGSFTGAQHDKTGLIEQANGGTLFIDEIGDMPLSTQVKLLRVLNDKIVRKIGAKESESVKVNFRLICATNQNLHERIENLDFREDLYYRISLLILKIPPLRERHEDLDMIAKHILKYEVERLNLPISHQLNDTVLQKLTSYNWPGNIRELDNVLKRALLFTLNDNRKNIEVQDVIFEKIEKGSKYAAPDPYLGFSLEQFMDRIESQIKNRALEIANGNQSEAARLLGITPQAINQFLKKTSSKL